MNFTNRLRKIEQIKAQDAKFCGCGTPYYRAVIIPNEPLVNDVCPDCQKPVKPQSFAEYAAGVETEVLYPKGETL